MLDFNNIPKSSKYSQEIYTVRHDTTASSATGYTWIKPRGVTFVLGVVEVVAQVLSVLFRQQEEVVAGVGVQLHLY